MYFEVQEAVLTWTGALWERRLLAHSAGRRNRHDQTDARKEDGGKNLDESLTESLASRREKVWQCEMSELEGRGGTRRLRNRK